MIAASFPLAASGSAKRAPSPLAVALALLLAGCGDDSTTGGGGAGGEAHGGSSAGGADSGGGGAGGGPVCSTTAAPSATVAITDRGAVEGVDEGAVVAFLGIPYAAPPIGELRWRLPVEHACFDGTLDATAPKPSCPQLTQEGIYEGDEDCLTLNVFRPRDDGAPRPVLFYIHGGGNIAGSATQTLFGDQLIFDGKHLAETQDAVVVTIEYRLGALGFLSQAALDAESPDGVSGNYAVADQLAALAWVQRNIAAFGGDPSRVLVFGESAGAVDTCTLIASPLSKGLFQAALMESGGCHQSTAAEARTWMDKAVDDSVCGADPDPIACLRALPADQLVEELPGSLGVFGLVVTSAGRYGPVVDDHFLPLSPDVALASGAFEPVPIVIGSNAEELAAAITVTVNTEAEYEAAVNTAMAPFGAQAASEALAMYPASAYATPQDALVALLSDQRFVCPTRYYARTASGHGAPIRRYFFSRRATTPNGTKPAQHGIELLYVFGTLNDIPGFTPATEDVSLSDAMMGYWASFARTGSPIAEGQPAWPVYDPTLDNTLVLDAPISVEDGIRTTECDFWESLVP
ncbi:MAG: carboxylesterase family protein [Polyangiaceae bacterium]